VTSVMNVGVVGCGNIFETYLRGLRRLGSVHVAGCADLDQARCERMAKAHDLRAYPSVAALLDDDLVDVVVNITPPLAHASVTLTAIRHGKHVFVEKPLAASLAEAAPLVAAAAAGDLHLGGAPDTFLAGPGQTARAAVDSGLIGEPIGVMAAIPHSRAEEWHPDPSFLFKRGGGPLLDMGPYYVTAMVNCLGAVTTVSGAVRIGANPRPVTAPGRLVDSVAVEVPTHAVAVLRFASGTIGTLTASFDLWSEHLPHLEIYGSRGILRLPDPDRFDGDVTFKPNDGQTWNVVPPVVRLAGWSAPGERVRGLGVADLVDSLGGKPQRTNAGLAHHVLEVLESVQVASARDVAVRLQTAPGRPEPVVAGDLGGLVVAATDVNDEQERE
jgi:predicted dehydrogenase